VPIELAPRAFSCWSTAAHARYVPSGSYQIVVGSSSRAPALSAPLDVVGTDG
jgi:Fibronectin type III-like domain